MNGRLLVIAALLFFIVASSGQGNKVTSTTAVSENEILNPFRAAMLTVGVAELPVRPSRGDGEEAEI